MSLPVGQLRQTVMDFAHRGSDPELETRVMRAMNMHYFWMCQQYFIPSLDRGPTELDFGLATATGLRLPANWIRLNRVRDNANAIEFILREVDELEGQDLQYRAYTYMDSEEPAFMGYDLQLQPGDTGATQFTSAELTADGTNYTGDYVRFSSQPGIYELTDADATPFVFSPAYHGPAMDGDATFQIRTYGSEKLILIDPANNKLTDRKVDIYYSIYPKPLYRDEDVPLLPDSLPLLLKVLRDTPETKERRPVSQTELDNALKLMSRNIPAHIRTRKARDINNWPIDVTSSLYRRRRARPTEKSASGEWQWLT